MNTTIHSTQGKQPVFIGARDLVEMGLYPSVRAVWSAVERRAIPFYKHGKKLLFKPEEVIGQIEATRKPTEQELERQAATHSLLRSVERF